MQPFLAAEQVKSAYRRYIRTSFPIRRADLRARLEELIDHEKLLWQQPFVSLSRPYELSDRPEDLVAQGILSPGILRGHWGFPRLFRHQAEATRRLSTLTPSPGSTIVATGTGSGKTEAFIIPIADHCMRNSERPGVQAVILYPMNALANDQLKRLRTQLAGTGVTFGRYTGDTPHDEASTRERRGWLPRPDEAPSEERYYRTEIQRDPPQILITNHTMLEYLLLRKREEMIFRGSKPRYLVLDEVHTYTGIVGTEVACLVRRLKEHAGLRPGELICVGTSATVKSGKAEEDERASLVAFATELFGEEFAADAIVDESYEELPRRESLPIGPPRAIDRAVLERFDPDAPESVADLYRAWSGDPLPRSGGSILEDLHRAIEDRGEFLALEHCLTTPRSLGSILDLARTWPGPADRSDDELRDELTALFLLGCAAIRPGTSESPQPRFRPRVHLLLRSLAPLNRCVACDALLTDGRTECRGPAHEGERAALGLGVCRSCGQDYLLSYVPVPPSELCRRGAIERIGRVRLSAAGEGGDARVLYLYPGPVADLRTDEEDHPAVDAIEVDICAACLTATPRAADDGPRPCDNPTCPGRGREERRTFAAFLGGAKCPICQGQGRGRRPEIITPMRSGAAASVSVITQSLLPQLRPGEDGGAGEKKVLIFADSRQDTAHQAGYLRDRHQAFTQRQLLYGVLRELEHEGQPWIELADASSNPVLANHVFLRVRRRFGEADALNLLTPVDVRSAEEAGFLDPDRVVTEGDRRRAIDRLRWNLAVEFTDRANVRTSLEREGIATVTYPGLDETARILAERTAPVGVADPVLLASLIRGFLDAFRLARAVDYPPFREYLDAGSEPVRLGIARPTRQNRTPVGFAFRKPRRASAYEVKTFYNPDRPGSWQTGIYNLVARACPHLVETDVVGLIDALVATLTERGYIRQVEIGRLCARYGRLATQVRQLAERVLEIGAGGERYRCDACGRTYAYRIVPAGGGRAICASYRCAGTVAPFVPDPEENFYVRFYQVEIPERLYTMEHSGQLSGEERVRIEQKFRQGRVNALVCTPTLELGVDIGDLVALVLRNVPPTPSNYAQRAGRAGRQKRIALILTHTGQGPHDSHFFQHPEEMIAGAIRPPTFLLDNRVVIDRHLNSLILEKLDTALPTNWETIRTEEGRLREEVLRPFRQEIVRRLGDVQAAVARAFVRELSAGGLPWLDDGYVRGRIDRFVDELRLGLDHWCARYREIYEELRGLAARIRKTAAETERERKLNAAIDSLEREQRYYPISYLQQVGFLPRYGFPGDTVVVRDAREREIGQAATVGIYEYAPGNIVYVAGRKLRVNRIVFARPAHEDPRQNAETYRYCGQCNYVTMRPLDGECEHCGDDLRTGRYVDYTAARAGDVESISQEDEYRDREDYDLAIYLRPEFGSPAPGGLEVHAEGWRVRYSRLREVEIFNRGRRDRPTGLVTPFLTCLECGMTREREEDEEEREQNRRAGRGSGHLPTCTVSAWNQDDDDRIARDLHLRAFFQGDVVEIELGRAVAEDRRWVETFDSAIRLGLQLELFVGPGEVGSFAREVMDRGIPRRWLVFYDMMPGGTGYLRRLVEELPRIAGRALSHLEACSCESACYRCLKEYWNQRKHAFFDKRLVLTALRALTTAPLPARGGRPADPDVRFESFLEARFYRLLEEAGLPLPATQEIVRGGDGRWITRADFTYDDPPLVILTDGRRYHAESDLKIVEDLQRRNALEAAGKRLLEFSYPDVVESPETVVATVRCALGGDAGVSPEVAFAERPPCEAERVVAEALAATGLTLRPGGVLRVGPGLQLETAAADLDRRVAVVLVDEGQWLRDREAWIQALRAGTQARLAGWRVFRVPMAALEPGNLARWVRPLGTLS